jgi:hypothetical protein
MTTLDLSIVVDEGNRSQALAISSTSAQSAVINSDFAVVTLTTPAFVRQGANPTATADGTDIYLLAEVAYRLNVTRGNRLAFRTAGLTGTAHITPGA